MFNSRPISVTIRNGERFYRARVTRQWAEKHDNGAFYSCGLSVPDDLSEQSLAWLVSRNHAVEISREAWNHSGCQSACILRGAAECRW